MARINEDIRFYLPNDPYYHEVDNLPLEDLLDNDKRLQNQFDEFSTNAVINRSGFAELKPYILTTSPGRISVNAGNFIGRAQRSTRTAGSSASPGDTSRSSEGLIEQNNSPAEKYGTSRYNVTNPPESNKESFGATVGRTSLFLFGGGSIAIDAFNPDEFETVDFEGNLATTAPKGRIDLIGITTREGAFDDQTWLPNNYNDTNIGVKDGTPRLAVVKGAGMLYGNENTDYRVVIGGEKYHTIGSTVANQNEYGRKFSDGSETLDPSFGTVPLPDDIVNICFHRANISQDLIDWATKNRNADFFLPIAYVFVPETFDAGQPISQDHLKDIRPFFRTAELTYSERQAVAASISPSKDNPFVTSGHLAQYLDSVVDFNTINERISNLEGGGAVETVNLTSFRSSRGLGAGNGGGDGGGVVRSQSVALRGVNSPQPARGYKWFVQGYFDRETFAGDADLLIRLKRADITTEDKDFDAKSTYVSHRFYGETGLRIPLADNYTTTGNNRFAINHEIFYGGQSEGKYAIEVMVVDAGTTTRNGSYAQDTVIFDVLITRARDNVT